VGKFFDFFKFKQDKPENSQKNDKGAGAAKDAKKPVSKKRKQIEIAAAVGLIIIIAVIYFSTFSKPKTNNSADKNTSAVSASDYCERTQRELTEFLSKIKGAGKVTVLINFESTTEIVIAYITNINTNTNVAEGGKYVESSQSTSNPVILSQAGSQVPLILKEIYPKVKGVIVGAEGASDVKVKLALIDAVRTYFKLSAADVQVYAIDKK
jgi:stage III sporulation protein AG